MESVFEFIVIEYRDILFEESFIKMKQRMFKWLLEEKKVFLIMLIKNYICYDYLDSLY